MNMSTAAMAANMPQAAKVRTRVDCAFLCITVSFVDIENSSINFVWLCGVVCVHLTTDERLSSVSISTDDSLNYLSGLFAVNNYPNPELVVADGVGGEKSVRCENLSEMDFSQGGDVYFYVAPGAYHTFTVTMTAADGRVCVKSQKEDMVVEVNRNNVTTIMAGSADHKLVFE